MNNAQFIAAHRARHRAAGHDVSPVPIVRWFLDRLVSGRRIEIYLHDDGQWRVRLEGSALEGDGPFTHFVDARTHALATFSNANPKPTPSLA